MLGLSVGWHFGHVTLTTQQRQRLEEYQMIKATFSMSEKEMANLEASLPKLRSNLERTDEWAAAIALGALENMEHGDTERAKKQLRQTISIYYRSHQADGNTNVLLHINQYSATNVALSNAIHRKLE
jgi:predicted negative regulator of RcsB-dependent stress response